MKTLKISYANLLFNFFMGVVIAFVLNLTLSAGINPVLGGIAWESLAVIISTISMLVGNSILPTAVLTAGVLKEIWISRLLEKYYPIADWLKRAQDMSGNVENSVIHLAEIGADPAVLINNSSYPVVALDRTDTPISLPLDYYDTTPTVVRNAEERQLAYNKLDSSIRQHGKALGAACSAKAAWNYSPQVAGAWQAVQLCNGYPKSSYAIGARLPFALSNIIAAEQFLDSLNIPSSAERIMVLSYQHKADLLNQDVNLFKGFTDYKNGLIGQLYGFDIYVSSQTATYNKTTVQKNAYGAAAAPSTDVISSFFFVADEVMYAQGEMDFFARLRDPEYKGDVISFQQRFAALSMRNKGNGAILDFTATVAVTNP